MTCGIPNPGELFGAPDAVSIAVPKFRNADLAAPGGDCGGSCSVATSGKWSFDAPAVTHITPMNVPSSGAWVTVAGVNFGSQVSVRFGSPDVTTGTGGDVVGDLRWMSDTAVAAASALQEGKGAAVVRLTRTYAPQSLSTAFRSPLSFDAPVVTFIGSTNLATITTATLSLVGTNFGSDPKGTTLKASVADTLCRSTEYVSATLVKCEVASQQVAKLAQANSSLYARLTVLDLVGTLQQLSLAYELDHPMISDIRPTNSPVSGGVSITLGGVSFGLAGSQSTAYLGSTACTATGFISETAVVCTLGFDSIPWRSGPDASGRQDVKIVADKRAGAVSFPFTYDAPLLTSAAPQNGVCSGGTSVTLSGTNFGVSSVRSGLSVAWGSGSRNARWISNTAVVVGSPSLYSDFFGLPVAKARNSLRVALADQATEATLQFRYDAAVATAVFPTNSPASGGAVVTISGMNYPLGDHDLTVDICMPGAALEWLSPNSVTCPVRPGIAAGVAVTATTASLLSATGGVFSYDTPVMTDLAPSNSPTSGGSVLTVVGFNFGVAHSSPLVFVGVSACSTTLWLSDTAVICSVAEGICPGMQLSATVSPEGVQRLPLVSSNIHLSYDPPVVTSSTVINAPSTAQLVTMNFGGINFGMHDNRQKATFGTAGCDDFRWLSDSSIMCRMQSNELRSSGTKSIVVASSCSAATPAALFTFDAPLLTHVSPCNTAAVSAQVDLLGLNFGAYANNVLSASIGPTACRAVQWVSATALQCAVAPTTPSARANVPVAASVGNSLSAQRVFITFDSPLGPPLISALTPVNAPISLTPIPLLISGSLFGSETGRAEVLVAKFNCASSQWISHTALLCMTRQINGAVATSETAELTVSRDGIATHVKWSFTIDAPVLTSIVPSNAAPTAAASLTLSGINFGNRAIMDLAVAIGETPAATITAWISGTSFVMEAQRAASSSRAVITAGLSSDKAGAAILAHTSAIAFAYDAPVVTAVLSGGVAQTVVSTISGANFGVADWTATVRIGVTLGLGTRWVSDTSLVVRLSLYPTPAPNRATQRVGLHHSRRHGRFAAQLVAAAGHKRSEAAAYRTRERGRGHRPQGRVESDGGISGGGGAPAVCMLGVVQLQRLVQVARLRGNCRAQAAELHMLRPS